MRNKKSNDDSDSSEDDVLSNAEDIEEGEDDEINDEQEPLTESTDKSITFIKLCDNAKTEIRFVYHISDIHIRNIERHSEYREVFAKTYKMLRSQIGKARSKSLIVLTGDIMHSKTALSPESFHIAKEFFMELAEIAPVILIPGNHDCNLSNRDRMDALSPIVAGQGKKSIHKIPDLYYLKKSGIYQFHNLVFGVTSVFDDVLVPSQAISGTIWKNINHTHKYKIALYHGQVHGAKVDVGYRMNNDQLLAEDFDGYDYVFLGDIHRFQYMNAKQTIAYSGSLIQQSYGESLTGHGILKWDLFDSESEFLNIKNDYGYCTIYLRDGAMVDPKITIPKKPRIRFISENTNQLQFQEILSKLEQKYQICEVIRESNFKTSVYHKSSTSKKKKQAATTYATQESVITNYLTKTGVDASTIKKLIQLHKKIYDSASKTKNEKNLDTTHAQKWKILELKFSNCLSYGRDNVIDFTKYESNKVIGIMAPNFYGKSAILDIILFCLFDRFSRGDRRDILNKNEKSMSCSLLFAVGTQIYLIERIGQRAKNGLTVKIDVNFYKYKSDADVNGKKPKREKLNGVDKNDTNRKIAELIGDYQDYLTTCFCLQQGKTNNFIDMTQLQKKEYLNEILKMNVYDDCHNIAKERFKELSGQLKLLEQKVSVKSLDRLKKSILDADKAIKNLEAKQNGIQSDVYDGLKMSIDKIPDTQIIKYDDLSDYDLTSERSIAKTIKKLTHKIAECSKTDFDVDAINLEIKNLESEREKKTIQLDSLTGDKNRHDEMSLSEYRKWIHQKELLLRQIVPVEHSKTSLLSTGELDKMQARYAAIVGLLDKEQGNDTAEKIIEINNLTKKLDGLRNILKPCKPFNQQDYDCLKSELSATVDKIHNKFDDFFSEISEKKSDIESGEKISTKLEISNEFQEYLTGINTVLLDYQFDIPGATQNDAIITDVNQSNKKWLDSHQKWRDIAKRQLRRTGETPAIASDMMAEYENRKKINQKINLLIENQFIHCENLITKKEINRVQCLLDGLAEFRGSQKERENLIAEKKLLREKIKLTNEKINAVESNKKIQTEIDDLQKKIDQRDEIVSELTDSIKKIDVELKKKNGFVTDNKKKLDSIAVMQKHIALLKKYQIQFMDYTCRMNHRKKIIQQIREMDVIKKDCERELDKLRTELNVHKAELEVYMKIRKEFDEITSECNLYQLYVKLTNFNGLPYEMLKTYLPMIEADVNQILHSMVKFSIEFMFYDESKLKQQQEKQLKSNIGSVDINIVRDGTKSYNAQLAGGFEKFIIGLAIRMTLCQISLTAKPNFLIIDEGFSCLDSDNLSNIGCIMNYIRTQYEHVIIISHLDELKGQADYIINIDKKGGYSYIQAEKKLQIKKIPKKYNDADGQGKSIRKKAISE